MLLIQYYWCYASGGGNWKWWHSHLSSGTCGACTIVGFHDSRDCLQSCVFMCKCVHGVGMAHTVSLPSWEPKDHFDDNIRAKAASEIVKGYKGKGRSDLVTEEEEVGKWVCFGSGAKENCVSHDWEGLGINKGTGND
ncbi:hypothetical protein VNO78_19616 [Psophocarpus tetragonolobus]|uniref:Uncharacterized protein n=1 Tax=Psophocarpus tetragonolobus TaxID=3891 RepID=A0AAN9S7U3_PSOTE